MHQRIEIFEGNAVDSLTTEIAEGLNSGYHTVPTSFGQQRAVVSQTQVAITSTEVDDFLLFGLDVLGIGQVFLDLDHIGLWKFRRPILVIFNHDSMGRHGDGWCGHSCDLGYS